jgi:hypothetical protein
MNGMIVTWTVSLPLELGVGKKMGFKKKEGLKGKIIITPKTEEMRPFLEEFIALSKQEWEKDAPGWLKKSTVFDLLLLEDEQSYIIYSVLPWGEIPFFTGKIKKKIAESVKGWLNTKGFNVEVRVE